MKDRIDGSQFVALMMAASAAVEHDCQLLNDLNVFPVPDGDTGTNMSLTLKAAAEALQTKKPDKAGKAAEITSAALLRGARGNSGVILSLLFRGIGRSLKDKDTIGGMDWAAALHEGVETAYSAVMKPTEGTILTVSRVAAQHSLAVALVNEGFESVLEECIKAANEALDETVYQNPVLTKAGVVDSGGKGLCIMLEAMLAELRGVFTLSKSVAAKTKTKADFAGFETGEITFLYCTEFIVERDGGRKDIRPLRTALASLGDSLVFVDDEEIIKVHLHTDHPGTALEKALAYGSLTAIKIDNMREQHTEMAGASEALPPVPVRVAPNKPFGFVAVCAGQGLATVFRDLGADAIIEGGQTMNPSTEDILAQIHSVPAETVFVLPNNKNIIMAAQQTVAMADRRVVVLETKTIPQGMGALLAFDPESDPQTNTQAMTEAIQTIHTGQITYAARDSTFDNLEITEGDHMALLNGKLLCHGPDQFDVCRRLAEEMAQAAPNFITIFFGEGGSEEQAEQIRQTFADLCPAAEASVLDGGQPVYAYLISAEA